MTCEGCARDKTITLVDGQQCCSYCPQWMLECEARHLLGLKLWQRRDQLDARIKTRGEKSVNLLKAKMTEVFNAKRKP